MRILTNLTFRFLAGMWIIAISTTPLASVASTPSTPQEAELSTECRRLLNLGEGPKAEARSRDALAKDANNAVAIACLGEALNMQSKFAAATAVFVNGTEIKGLDDDLHSMFVVHAASGFYKAGDLVKAETYAGDGIKSSRKGSANFSMAHSILGNVALARRDVGAASNTICSRVGIGQVLAARPR